LGNKIKEIKPVHLYIAGVTIFFIAIILSYFRIGQFYMSISEFGADVRTAFVFNFLVFIAGIVTLIGCIQLCRENFKKYGRIRSIFLIMCTAALSFIALFPLGISQYVRGVHHVFSFILFIGMPICMILFSTLFYKVNQTIFLVLSVLGVLDIIQIIVFYNNGQEQLYQWLGVLITLVFIFILLKFSPSLHEIKDEFEDLE